MNQSQQDVTFSLEALRHARLARRVKAKTVADALGISLNAYYKKERGESNISVNDLATILSVFDMTAEDVPRFFQGGDR